MVDRCTSGARECTSAASSSALRCSRLPNRAFSSSLRAGVARPPCLRTRASTSSIAWRSACSAAASAASLATAPAYSDLMQLQVLAIANRATAGRCSRASCAGRSVGRFGGDGLARLPPLLLQPAEVPDAQGNSPGEDEDTDDDEAGGVDVEVLKERPGRAVEIAVLAEQANELDRADEHRDEHRQAGDRHVVVDLADRLGERPVVGEVHEAAVGGIEEAHPCGEKDRQREDRVERQAARRPGGGPDEERDLGSGVEAEAEQEADRVHLPRRVYPACEGAEEAVHQAPVVQLLFEGGVVVGSMPHLPEDLQDADQDHDIERGDQEQKKAGHAGADDVGGLLQA